jgi:hypothetical protein
MTGKISGAVLSVSHLDPSDLVAGSLITLIEVTFIVFGSDSDWQN